MPSDAMQCFRGDAESYVDRLVEASAARPWAENYTGFGRELTPWMEDAPAPALCEALEPSRASPHHNIKHGRSPAAAAKRARPFTAASAPAARRCSLEHAAPGGAYACPSFAAAPKPEALPMPTSSLLTRALCRRSPSPPKMMPAATAVTA